MISFDRLLYITEADLNALKSFTVTVPIFTHAVRTDRFRNYISMGIYSTTRITLATSTEVTIYLNPL